MIQLGEHFGDDLRHGDSETARRRTWFIKARQDREKRELLADQAEDSVLTAATVITIATEAQIAAFETRLDTYEARLDAYEAKLDARDEAITKAMIANREMYDDLIELQNELLDNAYKLPDGRKVFKSESGETVHFRNGSLVPGDIITAEEIPDHYTRSERILGVDATREDLDREFQALENAKTDNDHRRDALGKVRDKISEARDLIDQGGMTTQEIEDLDADILDGMPPDNLEALPVSAAKFLANNGAVENLQSAKAAFSPTANPLNNGRNQTPTSSPEFGLNGG